MKHTTHQSSSSTPAVSFWEVVMVLAGAVLLAIAGALGLVIKFINNAEDPQRAKAIANSLIDYSIPGGAVGAFGANVGGAKIALIVSQELVNQELFSEAPLQQQGVSTFAAAIAPPPMAELFVARVPLDRRTSQETTATEHLTFPGMLFSYEPEGVFQLDSSRTENQFLCGAIAPITIQIGQLQLAESSVQIPAVRYDANVVLNSYNLIVTLSTLGADAEENAAAIFQSLQCQEN
jgi:hypothetical protein